MNLSKPLLSICIPTYNRASCLRQCLETIVAQFDGPQVAGQVEIVLSDNHSTDNTREVAAVFRAKYPNITYTRNEENVGYDRNLLRVVENAKGIYVWLLGDDDGIMPGSLEYLLPILKSGKFDYLLANGWGYDKELKNKAVNRPNLVLEKNLEFSRLADFIKTIGDYKNLVGYFGGMDGQIFKRQVWLDLPDKESFIGSQVIHLHGVLRAFKDRPACVTATPLYMGRADNMRWDIVPGYETVKKRVETNRKILLWVLNEYGIPYSPAKLKVASAKELFVNRIRTAGRKYILKNQKSRDLLKKFLGKL